MVEGIVLLFVDFQDTVVALGAIARLAKKLGGKDKDIAIAFEYSPGGPTTLNVNKDNSLVLQKAEVFLQTAPVLSENSCTSIIDLYSLSFSSLNYKMF